MIMIKGAIPAAICLVLSALVWPALARAEQFLEASRLRPDLSPFLAIGCVDNDVRQGFVCPPEVLRRFGCAEIRMEPNLGGLGLPIVACAGKTSSADPSPEAKEWGMAATGCMFRTPLRYIVYTTKGFRTVKSAAELLSAAGPLDTPEKAASFVIAKYPEVRLRVSPPHAGEVSREGAKAWREASWNRGEDAITVRLFSRRSCGCGTHPTMANDYAISPSGTISVSKEKIVQEQKEEICVD